MLPGGSGDADFHPFVKGIHEHVLDENYLIAQLVAPAWTQDQKQRLVWPIKKNPWQKMQFTTEEFVNAVIADVEERRPVFDSVMSLGVRSRALRTGLRVGERTGRDGQSRSMA